MLCPSCRRQLERGASYCGGCGSPLNGASAPLELVLSDATRIPVVTEMTIGRAPGATLVLSDPSVSRMHARILEGAVLEDAGSSHGTYLDGQRLTAPSPLRDGARIRLGDAELRVERRRDAAEAGRTIVVRPGASLVVPAAGASDVTGSATQFGMRPRVRSGYALKRLEAAEGSRRWVLKDLASGSFLRLSDNDAALFEQLDGSRSLVELVGEAEARFGARGPARLARLLSDLGERGFLSGVASASPSVAAPSGRLARLFKPREKIVPGFGACIERLYRAGGWVLFTRPFLVFLAVLVTAGIAAFVGLILGRYGTPFVVASKFGVGGVVFLLGRFAVVTVHELAHGLTMASFGRRVERAGLKLVAIFPYAFVDTSEAWFEPRRRRIEISAAGPVSDFSVGAVFALCCLLLPAGTVRDIFFNLAFAAYVGGFFNLNPFIERDGYHILVDALREPGLRRRAKEQLARRLGGGGAPTDSPVLARYSIFGLGWSVLAACFAIGMSLRYEKIFLALAPRPVVYGVMGTLWVAFFLPVIVVLGKPLWRRVRGEPDGER
ncbi:FHA domain-containing protein [Candidatus Solirubrobacter pratensis]|uniref:FHA domain-containing protein n=1 Tax=Candidatus Solirubrobacter pratensis TaxID=1298857 RepID=UPI00040D0FE3|nr:FHA domain-containing protein [Candidatus Solirubrobacter pratensis]